jgi:ribonucleoside-triphosphate reductase
MNALGQFVYLRTYSRFKPNEKRRETWKETVSRATNYNVELHRKHYLAEGIPVDHEFLRKEAELLFDNQFNLRQFLSGRTLWVGGAESGVAEKYPLANFNCSFLNIRKLDDIGDLFYLLLVGTGVGFKALRQFMKELPPVRNNVEIENRPYEYRGNSTVYSDTSNYETEDTAFIFVGDSKEGWVDALRIYFRYISEEQFYHIKKVVFNYNFVRPVGSKLKTFGGTASGPEPLMEMFSGFDRVLKNQIDLYLKPLEVVEHLSPNHVRLRPIHVLDIANLIGHNVVVGGVRRTSEIDLGDEDDYEFIFAKYGMNGIWGEEGFAKHEEIRQLLISNDIEVPAFWEMLAVRYYYVTDVDGLFGDKGIDYRFDTEAEAVKFAEDSGIEYYPIPANKERMEAIKHRRMSNNSVAFFKKPERWKLNLLFTVMGFEGEPGFINLYEASRRRLAKLGITDEAIISTYSILLGLNPCAEIILDSYQVCNLTTVNLVAFCVLQEDGSYKLDLEGLIEAQKLSARAGVRMTLVTLELPHWDKVQKRDRLIGTSLTGEKDAMGMLDYTAEQEANLLKLLGDTARNEADRYSKTLMINSPLLTNTIKPEGTLSQVAGGVSSGLHMSHSPFYIRRIRISKNDPLVKVAEELGWTINPETDTKGHSFEEKMKNARTLVIDFPIKSGSKRTKDDVKVDEQFDTYFEFQKSYTEHNSSNTIHVHPHHWEKAENRVWDGWDDFVGVSFLAHDGGTYQLAPYESITEEKYNEMLSTMKPFNYSLLAKYENPEGSEVLDDTVEVCEGGSCPTR